MPSRITVTGNVQSLFGVAATSGYVEFTLRPSSKGVLFYVPTVGALDPSPVRTNIDGSGNISVQVWGNDVIAPANTYYDLSIAPNGEPITTTVHRILITGAGPYSISNPVFAPVVSLQPQYQTIVGNAINTNLIPAANNAFVIGQPNLKWANAYFTQLSPATINAITAFITNKLAIGETTVLDEIHSLTNFLYVAGSGDENGIVIDSSRDSDTGSPTIFTRRTRGSLAARTNVQNNDYILTIGTNVLSGTFFGGPQELFMVDGAVVNGQQPGCRIDWMTCIPNGTLGITMSLKGTGVLEVPAGIKIGAVTNSTGLAAGTYNPTFTSVSNLDSTPTANGEFFYQRVGDVTNVWGQCNTDPTAAAGTSTVFRISLPVAANFTQTYHLAGQGIAASATQAAPANIAANTANDEAAVTFFSQVTTSTIWLIHFAYRNV